MSNTDTGKASARAPRLAEHGWIDAAGSPVELLIEATGISYAVKGAPGIFKWQVPGAEVGTPQTMAACFGARTLATNTVSQLTQAQQKAGERLDESAIDALVERFDEIEPGKWASPRQGGGGVRYDFDMLAQAYANVFAAMKGRPYKGGQPRILAKLNEDETFYADLRTSKQVVAEYARLRAEAAGPADQELFSDDGEADEGEAAAS